MEGIKNFIRREPAVIISVVLAALNLIFSDLTASQEETIRTIVESVLVLVGGTVVRQNVTPVAGK